MSPSDPNSSGTAVRTGCAAGSAVSGFRENGFVGEMLREENGEVDILDLALTIGFV